MPTGAHDLLKTPVAVLLTALLVSACTGGEAAPAADEEPTSTASEQPTSPASSTPAAETGPPDPGPVPEAPRPRRGPEGQRAFARHVVASWAWSLQANDAAPLLEAGRSKARPCEGCTDLRAELRARDDEGWYVELPPLGVGRTRLAPDGDAVVATTRVDIPESETYFYDGSFRSTNPAHDEAVFEVRMRRAADRYVLLSFTVS